MDRRRVRADGLQSMWSFLQMGSMRSNIPLLKKYCRDFRKLMTQKTAGQRRNKPNDISFDELDGIISGIVIEAMALFLSGDLDRLEKEVEDEFGDKREIAEGESI